MPTTLAEWLEYQQHTHKRDIAFGLDRVRAVWQRMGAPHASLDITIGGTNGKGSTVAFLASMLRAMGLHVGSFVSPHVRAYNERISIDETPVDDATLCDAFARIEAARRDIPLTYFEFSTLAALDIHARAGVDIMVLEVGMGGRLDATNVIDADVAVITTIDLDHMEWLGPDRDSIGREKAGIARAGRPVIIGEANPPQGLLVALERIGAKVERAGSAFSVQVREGRATWTNSDGSRLDMPPLPLDAAPQQANAAAAIAAIHALGDRLPWSPPALVEGLRRTRIAGRLQHLGHAPERVVDVAHNPQAAGVLAQWMDAHPPAGVAHVVYGAMDDKDVAGVVRAIGTRAARWHLGGLDAAAPERGLSMDALAARFRAALPLADFTAHATIAEAWREAVAQAGKADAVIAFGSFYVVAEVLDT